jgi:hypothetical protein
MKVHLKHNFAGYSGTIDSAVYYYHPRLKLLLMRDYVKPEETAVNRRVRTVMENLRLIHPSEAYKSNFRNYLLAYNAMKEHQSKLMLSWNNIYMKLLYAMEKTIPAVDLTTLSREQIYAEDLPCISLKRAVEAGLLPAVAGYEEWDKLI